MMLETLSAVANGVIPTLQRTGESPLALAGRVVGLGLAEQEAGIPKWAWLTLGLVAGGTAMLYFGRPLRKWVER